MEIKTKERWMINLKKSLAVIFALLLSVSVFAEDEKGIWAGAWDIGDVCHIEHIPNQVLLQCGNMNFRSGGCLSIDGSVIGEVLIDNLHVCAEFSEAEFLNALKRAKFST